MQETKNSESCFIKYQTEIEEDLKIDRFNLEECQLKLPGIKGKWIARLMSHKAEVLKLNKLLDEAIKKIADNIIEKSPVNMTTVSAKHAAEGHELVTKIRNEIEDTKIVVEYLEKMEKVFSAKSFDLKNLLDIIKQETS